MVKPCIRHREGSFRQSLEITLGVLGVIREIVRATVEETIDSDREEEVEVAAAPTGTEISAASKLQSRRCVK